MKINYLLVTFTGKKIASLSDSELGFSISGGLDYRIKANDGRSLDLWFGELGCRILLIL